MLNTFRKYSSGILAKSMLLFLVLTFGIWGIGDIFTNANSTETLATIGNSRVSVSDYSTALRNVRQRLGASYTPELIKVLGIPNQILDEQINNKLLELETEHLGIHIGDDSIIAQISQNTAFQDERGAFSKEVFHQALMRNALSEQQYAGDLKKQMAAEILVKTMLSSDLSASHYSQMLYGIRNETRDVTLYEISDAGVAKPGIPDDATLTDFYSAHSAEMMAPEYRRLSYVVIDPKDISKDITIGKDEIEALYNRRVDEFTSPETREIEQLSFASEDAAKAAYEKLKTGGEAFKIAAKWDGVTNKDSIDLGNTEKNDLPDSIAEVVFVLEKNTISEPVATPFGWSIYKVTAIHEPRQKTLAEVSDELEKELISERLDQASIAIESKLEDLLAGGTSPEDAATELGVTYATIGPVSEEGEGVDGTALTHNALMEEIIATAFTLQQGEESSLSTTQDGMRFIVKTDAIIPAREKALDEVKGVIIAKWQSAEFTKRYREYADNIAEKIRQEMAGGKTPSLTGLKKIATHAMRRDGSSDDEQNKFSLPESVVKMLFGIQKGQFTPAFKQGESYVIAKLDSIKKASEADAFASQKDLLNNEINLELFDQYMRYLRGKYRVEINYALFEQLRQSL